MTKPTPAECIEWLDREIERKSWPQNDEYRARMQSIIRAQLLAAQEMARALTDIIDGHLPNLRQYSYNFELDEDIEMEKQVDKALNAWREAGGE